MTSAQQDLLATCIFTSGLSTLEPRRSFHQIEQILRNNAKNPSGRVGSSLRRVTDFSPHEQNRGYGLHHHVAQVTC